MELYVIRDVMPQMTYQVKVQVLIQDLLILFYFTISWTSAVQVYFNVHTNTSLNWLSDVTGHKN